MIILGIFIGIMAAVMGTLLGSYFQDLADKRSARNAELEKKAEECAANFKNIIGIFAALVDARVDSCGGLHDEILGFLESEKGSRLLKECTLLWVSNGEWLQNNPNLGLISALYLKTFGLYMKNKINFVLPKEQIPLTPTSAEATKTENPVTPPYVDPDMTNPSWTPSTDDIPRWIPNGNYFQRTLYTPIDDPKKPYNKLKTSATEQLQNDPITY